MKYKGIDDFSLAEKYFNKRCKKCGRLIRSKDVIAMNLKMRSRTCSDFYCKKCFIKEAEITKEEWDSYISGFKNEGCVLF